MKVCSQGHEVCSIHKVLRCLTVRAARKQDWHIWRDVGGTCGRAGHRHSATLQGGYSGDAAVVTEYPLCYFSNQGTLIYFKLQS